MGVILIIRDSYGTKLYEVVRFNGEAEVFDYITTSKRRIDTSELVRWLNVNDIGLSVDSERDVIGYTL